MTAMIEELKKVDDPKGLVIALAAMVVWMAGVPLVLLLIGL